MPDIWMDVDAALSEVPVCKMPLIDDTDFKAREESVAYNQAGLDLLWNFTTTAGVFTQTAVTPTDTGGDYDWVNQGNGLYTIEIPASGGASINNDTEGFGYFSGYATGILPWIGPTIGFRAANLNNLLIDSAYSATRGLAGTALPDAVADAANGLPISDAGGLDLDTKLANTNEVTAARMGALTDLIDGGRLDLLIDAILLDTGTTLDALIKDIPTVAEFEARSDAAGTAATPAEVATALGTYDAPTKAEMDTAHALLATVAKQDVIDGIVDAVLADTGTDGVKLATDAVSAAALKADAVTEIWAKAMSDLAAGAPSVTASVLTAINYLYEALRNKNTRTSSEMAVYKDDGSTKLCEADLSDDGTTFTKGELREAD